METFALTAGDLAILSIPASSSQPSDLPQNKPDFVVDETLKLLIVEVLLDLEFVMVNQLVKFDYKGKTRVCKAHHIRPRDPIPSESKADTDLSSTVFRITRSSQIIIDSWDNQKSHQQPESQKVSYSSIGGLSEQIATIRSLVEVPLLSPQTFTKYGLKPPRGILLYGPPGTGKYRSDTLIARAVAAETGAHVITVNGPEITSRFYGETENRLRSIFAEAVEKSPSIIFLDEIDALCPKRDESANELEKRIVATLLTLMDGADSTSLSTSSQSRFVVIGATNRPNSIDEALRRPGRFDREIEIGIPNAKSRFEILETLLAHVPHSLTAQQMMQISGNAHGYVGADLAAVCREAGLKAIQRIEASAGRQITDNDLLESDLTLTFDDMKAGLAMVQPSAMREITLEVPKVLWTDIGGQADVKQKLKEAVEWPLKHPEAFLHFNISPPKGILLYGPPGCSKTLMAKALATEAGLNFLAVKGPELFSKWVGESEKAVQEIFRKARAASPSIIFFDEIDAIAVRRGGEDSSVADRVLSQLLSELDGIEPLVNVTVVAATNRPDILDSALLRPGRIDSILYVSPPDFDSRKEIFRIHTQVRMACASDVDPALLAELTDGFSGAETVAVCQEAAMLAMEEDLDAPFVAQRHFEQAIRGIVPRITPEMIQFYDSFRLRCGQVVVIGATNRIDSIDPALRRPGRFDREFFFGLPTAAARRKIIDIATKSWTPVLPDTIKNSLTEMTRGYNGADVKALCTEAALHAVRREYPEIYDASHKLVIDLDNIKVSPVDFFESVK
eukprot:jgi/Hompol1/4754/HPOL_001239-RA